MRFARSSDSFEHSKNKYLDSLYRTNFSPEFLSITNKAREESRKLNKEGISLSLSEAYLISELVRQNSCASFMELGSLTGYSALFLLRAIRTNGELYCFEKDGHCADFLENLFLGVGEVPELAGKKAIVMRGDAQETLQNWTPPSHLGGVFIDANKSAYPEYLNWIEAKLKGSYFIVADNVFLSGAVWGTEETAFSKKQSQAMVEFNKRLINSPDYSSYFVGTSEGLLVARRN